MPNLCERCSGLSISEQCATELKNHLKPSTTIDGYSAPLVVDKVYSSFFSDISDIVDSTSGFDTDFKCHLCLLFLRSLQTKGDNQNLVGQIQGPIDLRLKLTRDHVTIAVEYSGGSGYPLQICIGSDETCRGSDVSLTSSSTQVIATIKSWLKDCSNHTRCGTEGNLSWLPTRVIDIGTRKEELPRLHEASGQHGSYITLTHRWNRLTSSSSTNSENFESRKQSFDPSTLLLTFQDAIQVTRALGLRYLWIDSLCIIQDSEEDWDRESKNMMSIYESAVLNIASAGSERENGRLFMKRKSRLNRACRISSSLSLLSIRPGTSLEPVYAYLDPAFCANDVLRGFLNERAWIMQERILSPRTVYFGRNEVFWECSNHIASESVPWGFSDKSGLFNIKLNSVHGAPKQQTTKPFMFNQLLSSPTLNIPNTIRWSVRLFHVGNIQVYDYWYNLIEEYSKKDLTKESDKLPAISGIAQALHKSRLLGNNFRDLYQYGLWIEDLTRNLLWLPDPSCSNVLNTPSAPSYSWASCSGRVAFQRLRLESTGTYYLLPRLRQLKKGNDSKVFARTGSWRESWSLIRTQPLLTIAAHLVGVELRLDRNGSCSTLGRDGSIWTYLNIELDKFRFKDIDVLKKPIGFDAHLLRLLSRKGQPSEPEYSIGLILISNKPTKPNNGLEEKEDIYKRLHNSYHEASGFRRIGTFESRGLENGYRPMPIGSSEITLL